MNESSWICCQLGAREHYAVPRALFRQEALRLLITDAWVQPRSVIRALGSGLRERFHPELASASTKAWNTGLIVFEAAARIRKLSEWQRVISRNRWFQRRACAYLGRKAETPKTELIIFAYSYAARDTRDRPLRVLFLGQVNLRKGVAHLFNAIRSFKDEPIEFWFVGPMQVFIPSELQNNPRVRWFDVVSRGEVDSFYRKADLLILPTLSDGFGLTQLEAQAWSLPIVASRFCGEVVRDGQNGLLLENLTGETIREVLRQCVANPELLAQLAAGSGNFGVHSLDEVGERLFELLADGRQEAIPRRCA